MRRAYDEQTQKLENQKMEIRKRVALKYPLDNQNPDQYSSNFQRAYSPSIAALKTTFTTNQAPLHGLTLALMPTSASNPLTVVQNLQPHDGTSLNPTI